MSMLTNKIRNSQGAFDLPSVMVASIVSVIIAAGATVSVIGIARISLDNGAKDQISAITNAQKTYFLDNDRFGTVPELTQERLIGNTDANTCSTVDEVGSTYTIVSKSQTGNIFYATSTDPENIQQETGTNTYCLP